MIKVKIVGGLQEKIGREEIRVRSWKGMKVKDVVSQLSKYFPEIVKLFEKGEILASVNYRYAPPDLEVREGDLIILLPQIFGGR